MSNFNDEELTMRRLVYQLQKKYKFSYIFRRVNYCPDTRCNNYKVSCDIVKHFLEEHQNIPNFTIELESCYVIPLELKELEYGKNKLLATLLFPIKAGNETPNDHTTMPLVVLAAKLHPGGSLEYIELHTESSNGEDKLMYDGDMLMIWVCGHMPALRTVLKLTSAMETRRYVYSGRIHHLAENNHHPHMVFARGDCLLVPANHIASLTDNGAVTLDLSIQIHVEEQEL